MVPNVTAAAENFQRLDPVILAPVLVVHLQRRTFPAALAAVAAFVQEAAAESGPGAPVQPAGSRHLLYPRPCGGAQV